MSGLSIGRVYVSLSAKSSISLKKVLQVKNPSRIFLFSPVSKTQNSPQSKIVYSHTSQHCIGITFLGWVYGLFVFTYGKNN